METSFREYVLNMIGEGYTAESGRPLRCQYCESKKLEDTAFYHEDHCLVEYSVICTDCHETVGHWSYGNWEGVNA